MYYKYYIMSNFLHNKANKRNNKAKRSYNM